MITAKEVIRKEFISIDINSTLAELIGHLKKANETTAVVFDGKKYAGVAAKKWLLNPRIDLSHTNVRKFTKKVPVLGENDNLIKIAKLLFTADVRALPVLKGDKVVGVVRAKDLIRELKPYYKGMSIDEVAKMNIFCCNENDGVGRVMNVMMEKSIDRMPVVDKGGRLLGIVSLMDVLEKFQLFGRGKRVRMSGGASHEGWKAKGGGIGEKHHVLSLPIGNLAERKCLTADETDSVNSVIEEMIDNDVTSVVIVDKEKPIGIVTVKDLLKRFA